MNGSIELNLKGSDLNALQDVFRYAASTVGERVLRGKVLRWKPGTLAQAKALIDLAKATVNSEFRTLNQNKPDWINDHASWQDAPQAPLGWQQGIKRPHGSSRVRIGTRQAAPASQGWRSARPSHQVPRGGVQIGGARQKFSVFVDAGTVALKGNRGALPTDALLGLQEGVMQSANLFLMDSTDTKKATSGMAMESDPVIQEGVNLFADALRSSGIFDQAVNEGATELAQNVASCLPAIGAALTLSKAAIHTIKAGIDWYKWHRSVKLMPAVTAGLPRQALGEVQDLLMRMATEQTTRASVNGVAGALQTAGLFVDLGSVTGPTVGLVKASMELALTVLLVAIDFKEMRRGNKILLAGGPFDRTLLKKCPILACYVLTNCERSTLFAFLSEGPLRPATDHDPGWMGDVEAVMNQIDEVRRLANFCQRSSPFVLPGINDAAAPLKAPLSVGDHYLDFREHKTTRRFMWEAKMIALRDPNGLNFLKRKFASKGSSWKHFFDNLRGHGS